MTRTPMRLPTTAQVPRTPMRVASRRLKLFDTARGAQQWAQQFTYARAGNGLPALAVEAEGAQWWAVDPAPYLAPQPWRRPPENA